MEIDDLRTLIDEDLDEELSNCMSELMNLRFRASTMQLTNVKEIRRIRRKIARIKTIVKEMELAEALR